MIKDIFTVKLLGKKQVPLNMHYVIFAAVAFPQAMLFSLLDVMLFHYILIWCD